MAKTQKARLGDYLVEEKILTLEQLKLAVEDQKRSGGRLGQAIVQAGFATEDQIGVALAKQFGTALQLAQVG